MRLLAAFVTATFLALPATSSTLSFSTGNPDARMAMASRPGNAPIIQIEAADDFILTAPAVISHVSFFGLMPGTSMISQVRVKIYRIFPSDSANPPSGNVPTRTNSPADVDFTERDTATNSLTISTSVLNTSFSAANSVLNGINKLPTVTTGGDGPVSGEEVQFTVTPIPNPWVLPEGHYFLVPQVELSSGNFFWLSAPTNLFLGDLQTWMRDDNLAPDWLRVGTDIVGGSTPPRFNGSFSLSGVYVPKTDFNDDGTADVALRNASSGSIAVWLVNGGAVTSGAVVATPSTSWHIAASGDFNADGNADLLLQNSSTGDIAEWQMNGTMLAGGATVATPGTSWQVVGAGDFNGDGKSDILLQNSSTNAIAEWQMNGNTIAAGATVSTPVAGWKVVATGDINGDGDSDIILQNSTTGDVAAWQMNGFTIAAGGVVAHPGTSWNVISAADFNGDGKADLVVQNNATGDVAVWLMSGTAIASGAVIASPGAAWKVVATGDFNADGRADVLLQNAITGDIAQWSLNATSTGVASGSIMGSPGTSWSPLHD